MLAFFMPLMLIFNPTRKFVTYFSPTAFIVAFGVLVFYTIGGSNQDTNFFSSIFYDNYGSNFRHCLLMCFSLLILLNSPNFRIKNIKIFQKNDVWWMIYTHFGYIFYVLLISNIGRFTFVDNNRYYYGCSGVYPQDYYQYGQYSALGVIPYPVASIITYVLMTS
jgi:hypothetical protein